MKAKGFFYVVFFPQGLNSCVTLKILFHLWEDKKKPRHSCLHLNNSQATLAAA